MKNQEMFDLTMLLAPCIAVMMQEVRCQGPINQSPFTPTQSPVTSHCAIQSYTTWLLCVLYTARRLNRAP